MTRKNIYIYLNTFRGYVLELVFDSCNKSMDIPRLRSDLKRHGTNERSPYQK